ncbi:MAG: hypothetical protein MK132_01440 [Lentisphaerales bacterium]|nr:hypothetical protein [Lentisphaerales bacterium]
MKISFYLLLLISLLTSCQYSNDEVISNGDTSNRGNNYDSSTSGKTPLYVVKFNEHTKALPDDFFVMDGGWEIRKLVNAYALYLRPFPLRTYSLLFGPEYKEGLEFSADVYTSKRGQIYPNFSIGSHGLSGFRLNVRPGPRGSLLELYTNETRLIANAPCRWQTDMWSSIRLQVKEAGNGEVSVKGKLWKRGEKEPDWQLTYTGKLDLDEGQCSIWGIPYSGRDIFFDNLVITKP